MLDDQGGAVFFWVALCIIKSAISVMRRWDDKFTASALVLQSLTVELCHQEQGGRNSYLLNGTMFGIVVIF